MEDKKVFREVFNFFVKYRDLIGRMDKMEFWSAAAQELGVLCARLDNTDLAMDMLLAVYLELERRDGVKGQ